MEIPWCFELEFLGIPSPVGYKLGIFGKFWEFLGIFGNFWEFLGISGNFWEFLGLVVLTGNS